MVARNIDRLEALGDLVGTIVAKHVSLQVQPEHYPIVGTVLLRSIRVVRGAEVATDAVLEAWGAAYGQLADILIGAERSACEATVAP
jgi:nitric oxide dioxygenase